MRAGILVMAGALLISGPASAAIVLDQSDIPETGVIANHVEGGSDLSGNPVRPAQSFSVGKAGTLAEVDLALVKFHDVPLAPVQFDLRNTSNQILFSTTIAADAIPLANLQGQTWDLIPRIDVSAANLQVTPGEELWFTLTPNHTEAVLLDDADGSFQYLTGELFNFTAPSPTGVSSPVFGSTGDYGFRTFVNVADAPPPVIFPPGGEPGDNNGVDAVPEPAQWALMVVGFGGAGALLRRRRRLASVV
jgi:hypothetical protein